MKLKFNGKIVHVSEKEIISAVREYTYRCIREQLAKNHEKKMETLRRDIKKRIKELKKSIPRRIKELGKKGALKNCYIDETVKSTGDYTLIKLEVNKQPRHFRGVVWLEARAVSPLWVKIPGTSVNISNLEDQMWNLCKSMYTDVRVVVKSNKAIQPKVYFVSKIIPKK